MIFNQWYVILESKELKRNKPLKTKRFGKNFSLWRNAQNSVCCIDDECCHRGASLSCGKIINGNLECPFHGFIFDSSGVVKVIPANGKNSPVPKIMKVNAYVTYENYGLIWIWWGNAANVKDKPFFFPELADFSYASLKDHWKVHYSRAIENQLDVVHLPFIHRTTIGRGNKTLVNGPVVERNNELLTFYVHNSKDDGKTIPLSAKEIKEYSAFNRLQFYYPNIWQNFISEKVRAFAAFVPVDDENCLVYIRYYQKLIKIPLLKQIVNYLGILVSLIILRQDKTIVETQLPKRSYFRMPEHLIAGDKPIIEYRKHRQELIYQGQQGKTESSG